MILWLCLRFLFGHTYVTSHGASYPVLLTKIVQAKDLWQKAQYDFFCLTSSFPLCLVFSYCSLSLFFGSLQANIE